MQKLTDKIKTLISEAGYKKPGAFYLKMQSLHGPDVISPRSFYNLLNNTSRPQERTLFQVALALKTTTTDLRQGTDQEAPPLFDHSYSGVQTINDKATLYAYQIKSAGMPLRLVLKKGGQTPEERDPAEVKESCKIVFVQVGKMAVVIKTQNGEDRRELHKSQVTSFDARQPHHFINTSNNNSVALIVHIPAQNSGFYIP